VVVVEVVVVVVVLVVVVVVVVVVVEVVVVVVVVAAVVRPQCNNVALGLTSYPDGGGDATVSSHSTKMEGREGWR